MNNFIAITMMTIITKITAVINTCKNNRTFGHTVIFHIADPSSKACSKARELVRNLFPVAARQGVSTWAAGEAPVAATGKAPEA